MACKCDKNLSGLNLLQTLLSRAFFGPIVNSWL